MDKPQSKKFLDLRSEIKDTLKMINLEKDKLERFKT